MKRLLTGLIAFAIAAPSFAEATTRYIVATRGPSRVGEMRMLRDTAEVREFRNFDGFAADLTASEVAELRRSKNVRYVSAVVPRFATGNVPSQSTDTSIYERKQVVPWGIDGINARGVWPVTKGDNTTVHVAILDTGIDQTHPDLAGKYDGGYNVFTKKDDPTDDNMHGTHVAGIITANDNAFGTLGAAPNAHVWSVKVLDFKGEGSDETLIAGLEWVMAKKKELGGNWIVNLSLGASSTSDAETEMFKRVIADNILIIAAAGNRGFFSVDFPAAHVNVLAVCALEQNMTRAGFSSHGLGLSVCAPGVEIPSTAPVAKVLAAEVSLSDETVYRGSYLLDGKKGEVTGKFVYCGLGRPEDFSPSVVGKIALLRRNNQTTEGVLYFRDKVRNAKNAGAIGVVIFNNDDERTDMPWSLIPTTCDISGCRYNNPDDLNFDYPLVISISAADGAKLVANPTATITASYREDSYQHLSGTSMATPYTAAAAAMAWAVAPTASAQDVRVALMLTSTDLGAPGWDSDTAFGAINALKAAQYLNPGAFGLTEKPQVEHPRRRSTGR